MSSVCSDRALITDYDMWREGKAEAGNSRLIVPRQFMVSRLDGARSVRASKRGLISPDVGGMPPGTRGDRLTQLTERPI